MKEKRSTPDTGIPVATDRRFANSDVGKKVQQLLRSGSRSQRHLSEFILRDPVFLATHGIDDVSDASGISASTISRYVRSLGLQNYVEFRSAVADVVHALVAPLAKLGDQLAKSDAQDSAAETSLRTSALQTQGLLDGETERSIRAICAQLSDAPNIWIMGFGLSAHLAGMLTLGLQPYKRNVYNVVQFGGTEVAAGRLTDVCEGDIVVSITFPRYSHEVTQLSSAVKAMGAKVIAITDSPAAPLAQVADEVLFAPAQHPVLSSSSIAGLAVIEALVSEFLVSDPAHLERARRLTTVMSSYLDLSS